MKRRRRTVYTKNRKIHELENKLNYSLREEVRRRRSEEENEPMQTNEEEAKQSSKEESIASTIWKALSPKTKYNIKKKLASESDKVPGMNLKFREFGINLSNISPCTSRTPSSAILRGKTIHAFFERDDVSRICPDKKKMVMTNEGPVQIRYLTDDLKMLHIKYCAEVENCDYSTFTRHVPPHVKQPNPSVWGTCLCVQCLNLSLKHERLIKLGYMKRGHSLQQIVQDDARMKEFEAEMKKFHNDETIIRFVEWRRVENKDSSKGVKMSRKEIVMWPLSEVIKSLEVEVQNMQVHLDRALSSGRTFILITKIHILSKIVG